MENKYTITTKIVLHIPMMKWTDKLEPLELDNVLDELYARLEETGCVSWYETKIESVYKKRKYPELLLTIFSDYPLAIEEVFVNWFEKNNDILSQEALAYEENGLLTIIDL